MASMMACTSATAVMAVPVATVAKVQGVNASRNLAMAPLGVSAMKGKKLQVSSSRSRVTMTYGKPGSETAVGVPDPETDAEKETPSVGAPEGFSPPQLNPDTPSPIFGGSTGGLLRKAQVEEFYVITWEAPKEQIFELPTGGAAIMRSGPNLLKLARKEQCLALGSALRSKFKIIYQFYRVFPNGEVQYLHPKDGVYPEKVNAGRSGVGINARSIGKNANPVTVKFSGKSVIEL